MRFTTDPKTAVRDVIRKWFDAFADGDLEAARALLAPDALLHPDPTQDSQARRGFDQLLVWYLLRSEAHERFSWDLENLQATAGYVVAFLTLRAANGNFERTWSQVAVYRIPNERIEEIWLFEDPR